jgi:hypothetical protein
VSFQLVYGDHELALPLQFELHVEDQLVQLLAAYASREAGDHVRSELSVRVVDAISAMVEHKVVPPTEKQIKYAVAIARALSLHLSPEVLQHQDAMRQFLTEHADTYRRRKAGLHQG